AAPPARALVRFWTKPGGSLPLPHCHTEDLPMSTPRTLFITQSSDVLETVKGVSAAGHLSVCTDVDQACTRARRDNITLLLIDLLSCQQEQALRRLLWFVAGLRRACTTLVLANRFNEDEAATLFRAGVADCLTLPADLPRLAHLINEPQRPPE